MKFESFIGTHLFCPPSPWSSEWPFTHPVATDNLTDSVTICVAVWSPYYGHDKSVHLVARTNGSAHWTFVDWLKNQCCCHVLSICDQEMIKYVTASEDVITCKSKVNIPWLISSMNCRHPAGIQPHFFKHQFSPFSPSRMNCLQGMGPEFETRTMAKQLKLFGAL